MAIRMAFEKELIQLKNAVREMHEMAEISYNKLVMAAVNNQKESYEQLLTVNRDFVDMQRKIEAMCLKLLTMQQPLATDLRLVSAALKVVTDIERIGDHVTDMAELFLRLDPPYNPSRNMILQSMLEEAKEMLHYAAEAFVNGDIGLAEKVIAQDDVVDDLFNQAKGSMMQGIREQRLEPDEIVDTLMLVKYVEKIADHAVNICEWSVFQKTGDMQNIRLL